MPVFSAQDLCFIRKQTNKQNVAYPSLSISMPTREVGGNLRNFTRRHKTFSRRQQLHFNTLRTGSFKLFKRPFPVFLNNFNPLNAELNPICYFLALLAHHFLHVSRIRVKSLILRLLMLYIGSTYS